MSTGSLLRNFRKAFTERIGRRRRNLESSNPSILLKVYPSKRRRCRAGRILGSKRVTRGSTPLTSLTRSIPFGTAVNSATPKYSPVPRKARSASRCFLISKADTAVPAMERSLSRSTTAKAVTQARRSGLHDWARQLGILPALFVLNSNTCVAPTLTIYSSVLDDNQTHGVNAGFFGDGRRDNDSR